jgi:hypothetical protein
MPESLLSPAFLFRFATSCRHAAKLWPQRATGNLGTEYALPSFGELEGRRRFADLRMAWNESGLEFQLSVAGKSQEAWCRDTRVEDSDGLSVWLDTRDAHNIHRASRFCHRFVFLPFGAGSRGAQPVGVLLPINRARELPKPIEPRVLRIESSKLKDGYELRAFVPAEAITGYDPAEHPKLGFSYAVIDRELGWQTFTVGPEFPFVEDPSLWGTLELKDEGGRMKDES